MNILEKIYDKIKSCIYLSLCFRRENRIFTHLTATEKLVLLRLASEARPGNFVEIGSYLGASSCFIAAGIKRTGGKSRLYCVDTWRNDSMTEGKRDTYELFLKNTSKYSDVIVPVRNESVEAASLFNEKINFLFIDGGHSYEDVKKDAVSWMPKLGAGGIVIFHDYGWAEGVRKVIEEKVRPLAFNSGELPNMWWGYIK